MCTSDVVDLAVHRIVARPGQTQLLLLFLLVVMDIVDPAALELKIHLHRNIHSSQYTFPPGGTRYTNIPLQAVPDVCRIGDGTCRGNELSEAGFDGQLGGRQELLFGCDRPATDQELDHN